MADRDPVAARDHLLCGLGRFTGWLAMMCVLASAMAGAIAAGLWMEHQPARGAVGALIVSVCAAVFCAVFTALDFLDHRRRGAPDA